jgi:hypothetical protein
MSTLGLFAMGVLVTLIVGAGLSLLVYGAILDGRDEAQRKAEEAEQLRSAARRNGADGLTPAVAASGHGPGVDHAVEPRAASRSRTNRRDT